MTPDPTKPISARPPSPAEKTVTLTIDGRDVTVPAGTSIMRAAMDAGIEIPKLCATDMLEAFGSCRLCLVEIEGRGGTPASCTTPVARGHGGAHRRPSGCSGCAGRDGALPLRPSARLPDLLAGNGDCDCRTWPAAVGLREIRYGSRAQPRRADRQRLAERRLHARRRSNPYFAFDPAQCIVCSRCVRACDEVQGTFALTIDGPRLRQPRLGRHGRSLPRLRMRLLRRLRAGLPDRRAAGKGGDRDRPARRIRCVTTCAYCGVGCTFKAEMRGEEVVRMVPWKDGKANRGHSLRQGPLRLGLCQPQGPHPQADDPRDDRPSRGAR